jgi:hypothetical protein
VTLNDRDANTTFKYIAVLPHLREIAVLGTADLTTGRIFREGKPSISAELSGILERLNWNQGTPA